MQHKNLPISNISIQDWKSFNNTTFSADYKSSDWHNAIQIDKENPNLSFHNYFEEAEKMISNHAPLRKTRKPELKFQSKPWIISGLQKSIAIKNKLNNDYKNYRNMISALLK